MCVWGGGGGGGGEGRERENVDFLFHQQIPKASTLWCVKHLPQNRDVFLIAGGGGTLSLWK